MSTSAVPDPALRKMAKLGVVTDQWMKQADVAVSAVQCWTSLEENLGVVPCTIMSMMSDGLLSSACEVDICGVLGMHALRLASGTSFGLTSQRYNKSATSYSKIAPKLTSPNPLPEPRFAKIHSKIAGFCDFLPSKPS